MKTLVDLLFYYSEIQPNKLAYSLVDRYGRIVTSCTYSELLRRAELNAKTLRSKIKKGEVACIILPNGIAFIEIFFAILLLRASPYSFYATASFTLASAENRLQFILKSVKPKIIVSTAEIVSNFNIDHNSYNIVTLDELQTEPECNKVDTFRRPELSDTAIIQFTSGTSNDPKAIALTYKKISTNLDAICKQTQVKSDCLMLTWLPQSHDMGLIGGILVPFFVGGTCYILDTMQFIRDPLSWLKLISKLHITISPAPGFAYGLCNRAFRKSGLDSAQINLQSWVVAYNGSEPIDMKIIREFVSNFSIFGFAEEAMYPCYGLAEATLMVSGAKSRRKVKTIKVNYDNKGQVQIIGSNNETPDYIEVVSCGTAVDYMSISIKNDYRICNELEIGEIWIQGPSVVKNKFDDLEVMPKYNTKDIGFLFENELYVLGRSDDVVFIYGEKYLPFEIEALIPKIFNEREVDSFVLGSESGVIKIICEVDKEFLKDSRKIEELKKIVLQSVSKRFSFRIDLKVNRRGILERSASGKINRIKSLKSWEKI